MTNPRCPKCGKIMKIKSLLVESRENDITKQKIYGISKFWVCPNKSLIHGTVKYRVGAQAIV